MFTLDELPKHDRYGPLRIDPSSLAITVPKDVAGPLLEWRIKRIFFEDRLMYEFSEAFRLYGDLHVHAYNFGVFVEVDANSEFMWSAEPHTVRFWLL